MPECLTERRQQTDRRSPARGGRRVTDRVDRRSDLPACPTCRERDSALMAGESDGGWWFVCLACDYLWDQRHAVGDAVEDQDATAAVAGRSIRSSPSAR
jgi:hypothetical protein